MGRREAAERARGGAGKGARRSRPPSMYSEPMAASTVYLLGWTGAAEKHVQKYAEAWKEALPSCTTVVEARHCRIGVSEGWSAAKFDKVAEWVLERMNGTSGKRIVHVFSNGGCMLWGAISKRIHSSNSPLRFDALVFDSCPGNFRNLASGFAFLWESQRSPIAHAAIGTLRDPDPRYAPCPLR